MDLYLLQKVQKGIVRTEKFQSDDDRERRYEEHHHDHSAQDNGNGWYSGWFYTSEDRGGEGGRALAWVTFAFSVALTLLLGIPAAVLSWTSNTKIGWHPALKVFFSIGAFWFGLTYLCIHLVNKLDLLLFIDRWLPSSPAPSASVLASTVAPAPSPMSNAHMPNAPAPAPLLSSAPTYRATGGATRGGHRRKTG